MKKLFIIGGTMGVGKTAVCRELMRILPDCVFLDGDWCWDSSPFIVNDETKKMVTENVCFILNQFLRSSSYKNVIFCWVMHEQGIIDEILGGIDTKNCDTRVISLICRPDTLKNRLGADVFAGIRTEDVIERSIERIPMYDKLNTEKLVTDDIQPAEIAEIISEM